MGKHFVVIAFVTFFLSAVMVFFQRGEKKANAKKIVSTEIIGPARDKRSRVTVEEFVLYEYDDHHPTGTFQGKLAQFLDPDTLDIMGAVRGNRMNGEHKDFLASEAATLKFGSKGLADMMKDAKLETAEFENQVRFGSDDTTIFTDYAKYETATAKVTSERPVRIQNAQVDMLGRKGFEYDQKTQDVKVFGPMEGTLVDVPKKP
ncbi:MAG: LPS export ABC transporter periplasmic protein LptC [Chitinophagaceae bacterium]|nr:LPS export ABC transporter periplasmic protein LptC [Oligoflexus sp.]